MGVSRLRLLRCSWLNRPQQEASESLTIAAERAPGARTSYRRSRPATLNTGEIAYQGLNRVCETKSGARRLRLESRSD